MTGLFISPSKLPLPMLASGPHVTHGHTGPTRVRNANSNLIVSGDKPYIYPTATNLCDTKRDKVNNTELSEVNSLFQYRSFRYRGLKLQAQVVEDFGPKFASLEKIDPLPGNFRNSVPKGFTASQIHVLCAIFVKFCRSEIGKVVRYVPDKKNQNSPRCLALASMQIAPKIC